ncbi:ABC transporter ATP-binding protein [Shuttleworthella satelles]|uniref:ABC transporter ATP-binding protein n=1 Tax=Shuttleworthella satelles TaxID=177972 RepID=UPI0028D3CDF4|nr:ABC transporter ATP-binding protein [Shuttleworthia satelles]
MLEVSHLSKKYGKYYANHDLSFGVSDGEILIMMGPNGAGKSTAIKSIMGLLRHEGWVHMDGMPTGKAETRRYLGYVPEMPALYPNLTVDEHLEFIARAYRLKDYKAYKEELLSRMELTDKRKKFGDELSKGMQQKLSICCGFLPRPKLLIFDEPMIGLDPHAIRELKKMILELREEGKSVMISTHIIDSVEDLWDEALILKQGQILASVTRQSLAEQNTSLEDLYFQLTEGKEAEAEEARL